jgi:hypothetical protein
MIYRGTICQNGCLFGNNAYKEKDIVSIEVSTNEEGKIKNNTKLIKYNNNKIGRFFINNKLQPVSLSSVPTPFKYVVFFFFILFIDFI